MVAETTLKTNDLVSPTFVVEGKNIIQPINSIPGQNYLSIDKLVEECKLIVDLGIPAIMIFGITNKKDPLGQMAYSNDSIVSRAIRIIKKTVPGLLLVSDVCLCEYTTHGHCGIINKNNVNNDTTITLLAKTAVTYAKAGADIIAPSDMMDGRILEIRKALDKAGYENLSIISYAVKYASALYKPFRKATQTPKIIDRKSYQMDPRNSNEALREVALDINEGADIIMVKPALPYLDIINKIQAICNLPIAAYNVSGEYAMVRAAADQGWIDYDQVVIEILTSIKRAGANIILTYHAKEIAKLLRN